MLGRTSESNALGSLWRSLQCSLSIPQSAVVACRTVKLELGWSRDRAGEAGALLLPGKLGTHLALCRNKHFQHVLVCCGFLKEHK